jgi:hypothetical protein
LSDSYPAFFLPIRIPRLISPIREGYFENFQALPGMLDDCIIRAPETIQDKFFFSVLMEAGMVLSGRAARDYGAHFRLQRKPEAISQRIRTASSKLQTKQANFKPIPILNF